VDGWEGSDDGGGETSRAWLVETTIKLKATERKIARRIDGEDTFSLQAWRAFSRRLEQKIGDKGGPRSGDRPKNG